MGFLLTNKLITFGGHHIVRTMKTLGRHPGSSVMLSFSADADECSAIALIHRLPNIKSQMHFFSSQDKPRHSSLNPKKSQLLVLGWRMIGKVFHEDHLRPQVLSRDTCRLLI